MSATDTIKKDVHRTNWGSIERLNLTNYIDWKMNVKGLTARSLRSSGSLMVHGVDAFVTWRV